MKTRPDDAATGTPSTRDEAGSWGLTKREYIACAALTGLLTNAGMVTTIGEAVDYAVRTADALITRLNISDADRIDGHWSNK